MICATEDDCLWFRGVGFDSVESLLVTDVIENDSVFASGVAVI